MNERQASRELLKVARELVGDCGTMRLPSSRFCCAVQRLATQVRVGAEVDETTEEEVRGSLMDCLGSGLKASIRDVIHGVRGLDVDDFDLDSVWRTLWRLVKKKVNVREIAKDVWRLSRVRGWKFAVVAVLVDLFEDVVLPSLAIVMGQPTLVPIFMAIHLEPVIYPIALCLLRD